MQPVDAMPAYTTMVLRDGCNLRGRDRQGSEFSKEPTTVGSFDFQRVIAVDMLTSGRYLKRLSQNHLVAINRSEPTRTKGGRHYISFRYT